MAIYALKSGFAKAGGGSFRVELNDILPHGSMLAYDATKGAFVDVCLTGSPITGGISMGGANSHTVLGENSADGKLQFKEIIAGHGISITSDDDSITVSADDLTAGLSVPGDFRITIDNDNDQAGEARFELFTVTASDSHPLVITSSAVTPLTSSDVFTGNEDGHGYFSVADFDLWVHGFRPNMAIRVSDAGDQTGVWTIRDVTVEDQEGQVTSRLILQEAFEGDAAFNLGGPKPNVTFEHFPILVEQGGFVDSPYLTDRGYRLRIYGVDLGTDGFDLQPNMLFSLNGTPDNDGIYSIATVTGIEDDYSTVTVNYTTPFSGSLGLQEASIVTLEIRNVESSTGFYVTSGGHLQAPIGHFGNLSVGSTERGSHVLSGPQDVVRADNLDDIRRRISMPFMYFLSA